MLLSNSKLFSWICAFWKVPISVWEHLPWNLRGYWSLLWANLLHEEPFIHHLKNKSSSSSYCFLHLVLHLLSPCSSFPRRRARCQKAKVNLVLCSFFSISGWALQEGHVPTAECTRRPSHPASQHDSANGILVSTL